MAKKRRLPYPEGTWFAVPLRREGFAVGLLTRVAGDGPVFGYFFGPRRTQVPDIHETETLAPQDAIFVALFGDLGLLNGEWPVIGQHRKWDRDEWPLPALVRVDEMANKAWQVAYSDQLQVVSEEPLDPSLAKESPRDGLWGYGAVEKRLTRLLDR